MTETRFTEFPVLSVDPRAGISRSVPETGLTYDIIKSYFNVIRWVVFTNVIRCFLCFFYERHSVFFCFFLRTSFGVFRVSE